MPDGPPNDATMALLLTEVDAEPATPAATTPRHVVVFVQAGTQEIHVKNDGGLVQRVPFFSPDTVIASGAIVYVDGDGNLATYEAEPGDLVRVSASGTLDLNSGTKQNLVAAPSGFDFIATQVVFRKPDGAVTTAIGNLGSNAGADDWAATFIMDQLAGAGYMFGITLPQAPTKYTASGDTFGFKASTVEGSARTCRVDVVGYFRPV